MSDQLPIGLSGQQTKVIPPPKTPVKEFVVEGLVTVEKIADTPVTQARLKTLRELELEHIERALEIFKNNKTKASEALGITIKTLYNKLHEHGLFEKYAGGKK